MAGGQTGGEAAALALDPATGLIAAIMLALVLTALALANRPEPARPAAPRQAPGRLSDWFETGPPPHGTDPVERRTEPGRGQAVVAVRFDHSRALGPVLRPSARRDALAQAARVLRARLRRSDRIDIIPGEGFVIVLGGARETEAAGIAERLRRAARSIRIPGLGGAVRMTMSFGVAGRRAGDSPDAARARASSALDAAAAGGRADCVVMASEIEEVLFLPAPTGEAQAQAA